MRSIKKPTAKMNDDKNCLVDDAMRTSANELTKKLYLTVMDVFGNHIASSENEYTNMLETLHARQMEKQQEKKEKKISPPAESYGMRKVIAQKLLEGYTFHGDGVICDKCVMPLMTDHGGKVSCVIPLCKGLRFDGAGNVIGGVADAGNPLVSPAPPLALASTSDSDLAEEEREGNIIKQLTQFNERRSQATNIYAAKLLSGYTMQDKLCEQCDLPMMKHNGSVECVVCPKKTPEPINPFELKLNEAMKEAIKATQASENAVAAAKSASSNRPEAPGHKPETPKAEKPLSQAEVIAERLRGMRPKVYGEESDLDKAEREIMKMMENLQGHGNQDGEVSASLQDYFSRKKADRAIDERLKAAEKGIHEAEVIAATEELNYERSNRAFQTPVDDILVDENENGVFVENGLVQPLVPSTPKFESSISCSIGDALLPSLKSLFTSASHPVKVEEVRAKPRVAPTGRLEARKWVSSNDFPMVHNPMQDKSNSLQNRSNNEHEDILKKMVNQLMEGWIILDGQNCPVCYMPTMLDPKANIVHCVNCGYMQQTEVPQQASITSGEVGSGSIVLNTNAMRSNLNASALSENTDPNPKPHAPSQLQMSAKKTKLRVEIAPEPIYMNLPDPTTSNYELRGKLLEPEPSMQVRPSKLGVATDANPLVQHIMGAPTPATKAVRSKLNEPTPNMHRSKLNEPTPNMQAVRNKLYALAPKETSHYSACDPTPNMQIAQGRLMDPTVLEDNMSYTQSMMMGNNPTPVAKSLRYKLSEPTPNMQAVRNKLNEPYHAPCNPATVMNAKQSRFYTLEVSTPAHPTAIRQVDPSPTNLNISSRMVAREAPGQAFTNMPSID